MAVNKVEYGDEVLVDLTEDTVTADALPAGTTAHNAGGEKIVGTRYYIEGTTADWGSILEKPFETVGSDFNVSGDEIELSEANQTKLSLALSEDEHNLSKTYSKDQLCIKNNIVYRSKVDNNTGHSVTDTNYWEATTLGAEIGNLKQTLTNLKNLNISYTYNSDRVDIKSFTDSKRYVAPCDGYGYIVSNETSSSSLFLFGSAIVINVLAGKYNYNAIYVKKGTNMYVTGNPSFAFFVPIAPNE